MNNLLHMISNGTCLNGIIIYKIQNTAENSRSSHRIWAHFQICSILINNFLQPTASIKLGSALGYTGAAFSLRNLLYTHTKYGRYRNPIFSEIQKRIRWLHASNVCILQHECANEPYVTGQLCKHFLYALSIQNVFIKRKVYKMCTYIT